MVKSKRRFDQPIDRCRKSIFIGCKGVKAKRQQYIGASDFMLEASIIPIKVEA